MGRANNNRKVPRHRIISYSGEALVNERVLFFVKAIVFFVFFFGFAFALGRDFPIDSNRADQRDDGDDDHQRRNDGEGYEHKAGKAALIGKYVEGDDDECNGGTDDKQTGENADGEPWPPVGHRGFSHGRRRRLMVRKMVMMVQVVGRVMMVMMVHTHSLALL